jgi:hypothetical protein
MKIEKNVPIPTKRAKYDLLIGEIKVGDSFEVDTYSERSNAYIALVRAGFTVTTRAQDNGKYRIWRTS